MKKGSINPHLYKARIGNCRVCNKEFRATKDFKERKQVYCSKSCYQKAWVIVIRPKMKNNPGVKGELNASWKGNMVGYWGVHRWIYRQMGKPNKCEHCKSEIKRKYEWCNVDHEYKRDVKDWIRLCTSCHRRYDAKMVK